MSTRLSQARYAILGAIILVAVITAGCTSSYGPAPATTQTTAAATATATTPVPTLVTSLPTTVPSTTALTTPATTVVQTPALPVMAAVTIENFTFIPASLTVPVGSTVTWTNRDAAAHQVASDTMAFMGNPLSQGSSYSFTFMTRGTFPYHCAVHPTMKGTITVT